MIPPSEQEPSHDKSQYIPEKQVMNVENLFIFMWPESRDHYIES